MAGTDPSDLSNLSRIDLLVLDVDGVLTDGRITLNPSGQEIKSFHAHDGAGMKYWRRAGKKLAIERFERSYLRRSLERHETVAAAARAAGLDRANFRRLLRRHELTRKT